MFRPRLKTTDVPGVGKNISTDWGPKDYLVIALLRWFKKEFFQWANCPPCSQCEPRRVCSKYLGFAPALPDEVANGTTRVQLFKCLKCGNCERIPSWTTAADLLRSRRGRSNEWAVCFGLCCRAMGYRVRYVWNGDDHYWNEVFSEHANLWVHVDADLTAWDKPEIYASIPGNQLSYCMAFSVDGVVDVTSRYVSLAAHVGPRDRCSAAELLLIMDEICTMRQRDLSEDKRQMLQEEHDLEKDRIGSSTVSALVDQLCALRPEDMIMSFRQ